MIKRIVHCSLMLLILPVLAIAGKDGNLAEKKIIREFVTRTDGNLEIENKYGSIDVVTGPANRISFEVVVMAECSSAKKAQEAIGRVNIEFQESPTRVSALTIIQSASGIMSWFDTDEVNLEINYKVTVPADVYMDLTNKYGNIYVETTSRDLDVNLSYGDIRLGDINARLSLEMAYSDGAISKINKGNLMLSYSNLEMEDAQSVDADMKYSDLAMGSAIRANIITAYSDLRAMDIDELTYRGKYDDVVIERVKTIDMESAYSEMRIGGLSAHGRFDMRYGDLQISNIAASFTRLDVNTSYTGVVLRFSENTSYTLDAANNYCDIHQRGLRVTEDIQKGGSTTLKGSKGSGGGLVVARMNYGELSIE